MKYLETVFANSKSKAASIVPSDMKLRTIIDVIESAHTARSECVWIVFHFREPDASSFGVLIPEKFQPFFLYLHLTPPTWSCPDLGPNSPTPDELVPLPQK